MFTCRLLIITKCETLATTIHACRTNHSCHCYLLFSGLADAADMISPSHSQFSREVLPSANPDLSHSNALLRVLKYLANTITHGIVIRPSEDFYNPTILAYTDASYE
ncbi:hypothetical protein PPROV_000309500 [Pycnococcus provasolii]|uniref:Uncharacterized protein n=1 Tax=Pycnococcus provasolii TaxID=41880 RepID=A0A830HFD5_9CHLO|nr:hypothetical protein PPROV_000309500 [Pycnococcus provasolii]